MIQFYAWRLLFIAGVIVIGKVIWLRIVGHFVMFWIIIKMLIDTVHRFIDVSLLEDWRVGFVIFVVVYRCVFRRFLWFKWVRGNLSLYGLYTHQSLSISAAVFGQRLVLTWYYSHRVFILFLVSREWHIINRDKFSIIIVNVLYKFVFLNLSFDQRLIVPPLFKIHTRVSIYEILKKVLPKL